MSNAVHYKGDSQDTIPVCWAGGGNRVELSAGTANRSSVTCKRCLKALAKRDRAFQRKARETLAASRGRSRSSAPCPWVPGGCGACLVCAAPAARAIAAEEGRLL
jgi:hypothetical protein